ncbi:hypothetical protein [Ensifer sp. 4252]
MPDFVDLDQQWGADAWALIPSTAQGPSAHAVAAPAATTPGQE